jgi:hypothetical protein
LGAFLCEKSENEKQFTNMLEKGGGDLVKACTGFIAIKRGFEHKIKISSSCAKQSRKGIKGGLFEKQIPLKINGICEKNGPKSS